jgi:hypothetical protein
MPIEVLPYYSSKLIFSTSTFLVALIFMLCLNLITYKKYGVFHQNEFYKDPYETLKIKQLAFCFLGGLLLFTILYHIFFIYELALNNNINSSVNTSILCFTSVVTLMFQYLIRGAHIK